MKPLWIKFIFLTVVFQITLLGNAQEVSKYGFELREYLKQVSPDTSIPLLVEGDPKVMREIVDYYEGNIRLQIKDLFSLEIPARNVKSFSMDKGVKQIEFSLIEGRTMSDTMLIQTNVDSIVQQHFPLRTSYTGKGVVIGFIDSGIELSHPDFQDSTGNTRVMYVWDQGVPFDPNRQALNYSYGVEWDSAAINSGVSTHDDKASEFGHGSNVAGAAASNGLATGNYRGVAPEVNIISVATDFRKPNWLQTVAEAVDYIYKKADELGMPCVINASVGTYVGSHDGKDIAARMIDNLIQQKNGRAFVCAAGNAGTLTFHVRQETQNDTAFTWFENEVSQWAGLGGYYFEVWSDTNDFNNVSFSIGTDQEINGSFSFRGRSAFDNIRNRLNVIYSDSIMSNSGNKIADIQTYAEESQGRYKLEVAIIDPDSVDYLYRFETIGNGKLDIWSSFGLFRHNNMRKTNLPSVNQFPSIANYVQPDSLQTMVSSFTCLPSAITVGNYVNRGQYVDVTGTTRQSGVTPGQISVNSSLGPNRNDFMKPDVVSAGDFMFTAGRLATIADAIQSNPTKVSHDSMHFRNGGTSLASPTVAGMVALYLQQCPNANNSQIKTDLIASTRSDQYTINLPNPKWGNGKADGFQFLSRQTFAPTISTILPNLCVGDSVPLSSNPNFNSFLWNTGDTTSMIQAKTSGDYYVTVENQVGCLSPTDTISLSFLPTPPKPIINQNGNTLSIPSINGTYQWFLNNIKLSQTDSSILALNNGDYYCKFTDSNGCSANSDTISIIITSVKELSPLNSISITPNPSKGYIFIHNDVNTLIERIHLLSSHGSFILSKKIESSRQQIPIDLSHLPKGFYFMKIYTGNSSELIKLVIQ